MVAVIDIDGVLADVRHRLHHVTAGRKDWDAFFAAAPEDPVLEEGRHAARKLGEVYRIVYVSGRPERCRTDTLAWLERHALPAGDLHLRRRNDYRPARLVKVEVLDRLAQQAPVAVLVDDDPQVCQAARDAGYDVLPADWMPAQASLHEVQETDGRT